MKETKYRGIKSLAGRSKPGLSPGLCDPRSVHLTPAPCAPSQEALNPLTQSWLGQPALAPMEMKVIG